MSAPQRARVQASPSLICVTLKRAAIFLALFTCRSLSWPLDSSKRPRVGAEIRQALLYELKLTYEEFNLAVTYTDTKCWRNIKK